MANNVYFSLIATNRKIRTKEFSPLKNKKLDVNTEILFDNIFLKAQHNKNPESQNFKKE